MRLALQIRSRRGPGPRPVAVEGRRHEWLARTAGAGLGKERLVREHNSGPASSGPGPLTSVSLREIGAPAPAPPAGGGEGRFGPISEALRAGRSRRRPSGWPLLRGGRPAVRGRAGAARETARALREAVRTSETPPVTTAGAGLCFALCPGLPPRGWVSTALGPYRAGPCRAGTGGARRPYQHACAAPANRRVATSNSPLTPRPGGCRPWRRCRRRRCRPAPAAPAWR